MSAFGPKRTFHFALRMSPIGRKADMAITLRNVWFCRECPLSNLLDDQVEYSSLRVPFIGAVLADTMYFQEFKDMVDRSLIERIASGEERPCIQMTAPNLLRDALANWEDVF
jgi:hypothetical protein